MPVYNEEKTIREIIEMVHRAKINGVEKEIIVVNDGSTDASASEIKNKRLKTKNIKIYTHAINRGKGAAVRTGIKHATGDYIIIQDADLEYDPKYINKLLEPIREDAAKVVYGTRLKRWPNLKKDEKTPRFLLHYLGNRFLSLVTSILYGQWLTDMETCYKLFPRSAVEDLHLEARGFEFEPEITAKLLKKGYKIMELPIKTKPRGYAEGKKLNTFNDGVKAFWALIKYRFVD